MRYLVCSAEIRRLDQVTLHLSSWASKKPLQVWALHKFFGKAVPKHMTAFGQCGALDMRQK